MMQKITYNPTLPKKKERFIENENLRTVKIQISQIQMKCGSTAQQKANREQKQKPITNQVKPYTHHAYIVTDHKTRHMREREKSILNTL